MENCIEYQKRYEQKGNRRVQRIPIFLSAKSDILTECYKNIGISDAEDGHILINYTDEYERHLKLLADLYEVDQLENDKTRAVKGVIISSGKIRARNFPFCPKLVVDESALIDQMEDAICFREWKEGVIISVWWNKSKMMISTSRTIDARTSRWFGSPTLSEMIEETGVDLSQLDQRYNHILLLQHPYMLMQSQEDISPCIWHLATYKRVKSGDLLESMKRKDYIPPPTIRQIPNLSKARAVALWRRNYPIFVEKEFGGMIFMTEELINRYDIVSEQRNVFIRYFTLGPDRKRLQSIAPVSKKPYFDQFEEVYQNAISNLKNLLAAEIKGEFPIVISHRPVVNDAKKMLKGSLDNITIMNVIEYILSTINSHYLYTLACSSKTRNILSGQIHRGLTLDDLVPELRKWLDGIYQGSRPNQVQTVTKLDHAD